MSPLPARASTYPLRQPRNVAPRIRQEESLDIAELCRRLEALRRQRRGHARQVSLPSTPTTILENVPYRHVPQTAAKDFIRTTTREMPETNCARSLSPDPLGSRRIERGNRRKSTHRLSLGPRCGLTDLEPVLCRPLPISDELTTARSGQRSSAERAPSSVVRGCKPRTDPNSAQIEKKVHNSDRHIYDTLMGADENCRGGSLGDVDCLDGTSVKPSFPDEVPIVAHKISRRHLEDRADWTQSDRQCNTSKYAFKAVMTPLFRSLSRKVTVEQETAATDRNDVENFPDSTRFSRRRSSFLARFL